MVYLIIGRRKRGKTTLAVYMLRKGAPPSRLIFDPRGMVPVGPGAMRVTSISDFTQHGFPLLVQGDIDELIFSPQQDDLTRPFEVFSAAVKQWIMESPTRRLGVLIDELSFVDESRRDPAVLRRALRSCEPEIVDVYITCHRPSDVPTNTRSIADRWLLFQVTQEHDLDVIRRRCRAEVVEQVQSLSGRSFLLYRDTRSVNPATGVEEDEYTLYPERLNEHGQTTWYVPLMQAGERGTYADRLADVDAAKKPVDARKLFD